MNRIALGILILIALELASDVFIVLYLGGWSLLVLPFVISIQVVFDFILLAMIGFASYSRKTRVIQ
ncbi:MAG: hypothetical protein LVQ63_07035 [Thermoplasmatales archaeon]|nr:hypothetical protein [Thermoplasmatales archaeon]